MFFKKSLILTAVCIFIGTLTTNGYTGTGTPEKKNGPPAVTVQNGDSLFIEMNSLLERQSQEMGKLFDRYFGENFFTSHSDPFSDLDTWGKKAITGVDTSYRQFFGSNWDAWYNDRFGTDGIKVSTKKAGKKVILDVKVPDVNADAVSVDVNAKRIKLEYNMRKVNEKKNDKGKVVEKIETEQHMVKVLPTPDGVNAGETNIIRSGSEIKIEFPKKA